MARFDPTDFEWRVTEPLLPTDVRGVPRCDNRQVLDGIMWRPRTGAASHGRAFARALRGRTFRRATVRTRPA